MLFDPMLTPKEMLHKGIFGGTYFNELINYKEFPSDWFQDLDSRYYRSATYCRDVNYFGVKAGLSRLEWKTKGWIFPEDPLGWFQWYCRYTMGRRIPSIDRIQIERWKMFGPRHIGGIKKNCKPGDHSCRIRQRQALLQWGYNPFF